jgi:hypothetical protein
MKTKFAHDCTRKKIIIVTALKLQHNTRSEKSWCADNAVADLNLVYLPANTRYNASIGTAV